MVELARVGSIINRATPSSLLRILKLNITFFLNTCFELNCS